MMMLMSLRGLTGQQTLAGGEAGRALHPQLEQRILEAGEQPLVVLDFSGIEFIAGSYFLAAFQWLWERELILAIANASPDVRADIEIAIKAARLKTLFATINDGRLFGVEPFNLEPLEAETYNKVRSLGTATANDLHSLDRTILPTAWSNRLALLFKHRLLHRESVGRQLAYSVCEARPSHG
jgi:hypothetical protein